MWNFFRSKPQCPVEPEEQRWLDARFAWLLDEFGPETPRMVEVILPTDEFFPDAYNAEPDDALAMFSRVACYMGVDPTQFKVFFFDANEGAPAPIVQRTSTPAGVYLQHDEEQTGPTSPRQPSIGIEFGQLNDPPSLVATIAHEIGHEILLGQGRVLPSTSDHEPLTDLLTVFLGLGVFTANATIRDRGWSDSLRAGWYTSSHGYLSQPLLGYALAKFALAREDPNPDWINHLRPDMKTLLKQGLRFLRES